VKVRQRRAQCRPFHSHNCQTRRIDPTMFSSEKVALILGGSTGGQLCSAEVSSLGLRQRRLVLAFPLSFVQ
jgi:hypothetical protein